MGSEREVPPELPEMKTEAREGCALPRHPAHGGTWLTRTWGSPASDSSCIHSLVAAVSHGYLFVYLFGHLLVLALDLHQDGSRMKVRWAGPLSAKATPGQLRIPDRVIGLPAVLYVSQDLTWRGDRPEGLGSSFSLVSMTLDGHGGQQESYM